MSFWFCRFENSRFQVRLGNLKSIERSIPSFRRGSDTVGTVGTSKSVYKAMVQCINQSRPCRSKSDAAGKMKRPKAGSSDSGRQSGSSTPRGGEHGRSPPPTPAGGASGHSGGGGGGSSGGGGGGSGGGYLPNTSSPYTTYHGGMFSGPQRGQKQQGGNLSYLFADPRALLAQVSTIEA